MFPALVGTLERKSRRFLKNPDPDSMKKQTQLQFTAIMALGISPGLQADAQVPETIHYQGRVTVNGAPFDGTGEFKFALVDDGTENVRAATAAANVDNGFVTSVSVIDSGNGYTAAPTVVISGAGGSGAAATAVVENGEVVEINVDNAGSGYTDNPKVAVDAPPPATIQTLWSHDGTSSEGGEPGSAVSLPVGGGVFSVVLGDTNLDGMGALPSATFDGSPAFLRVWFDDGGGGGFQQLAPDQALTATPYAMRAGSVTEGAITSLELADGAVGAEAIADGAVDGNKIAAGSVTSEQLDPGLKAWSVSDNGIYLSNKAVGLGTSTPGARLQVIGSAMTGLLQNEATGENSFVAGGHRDFYDDTSFIRRRNRAIGDASFVGGGGSNRTSGDRSFVGGGVNNEASGRDSAVVGGSRNDASGIRGFVGGGSQNEAAGTSSFAAGSRARALHDNTFVWSSRGNNYFSSTDTEQFLIRAWGGVGINTNAPVRDLHVKQSSISNDSIGLQIERSGNTNNWAFYIATSDNLGFRYNDNLVSRINHSDGEYVVLSDRRKKASIKPLDRVLDRVLRLRPSSYFMKSDTSREQRSIGLIAQDVEKIFPSAVSKQEGLYGVSYGRIGVLTTSALIELHDEFQERFRVQEEVKDELRAEVAGLRAQVAELTEAARTRESKNEKIEERLIRMEKLLRSENLASH
jgi:hypothetical protein